MTALKTVGHTPGCTSWALPVRDDVRILHVLFACSLTVGGHRLIGNAGYPDIVEVSQMAKRRARAGDRNAWVDPAQLGRPVAVEKTAVEKALALSFAKCPVPLVRCSEAGQHGTDATMGILS
ncbi:hypothetical protein [Sphingomonas bacterium]|uniref:hypothetical protein n=1 Tax=Sphingomonas bacterium TaxID=1895847 RepID=UPI001575B888|nr:hypothetical protein [Sphingomonas bacterium]